MTAHAGQARPDFGSKVPELVTGRAGGLEHQLAAHCIARFFHQGSQLGDDFLLGLGHRIQLIQHVVGTLGDHLVRIGPEPESIGRAEAGRVDLFGRDGIQQGEGPVSALQQGLKGDVLHVRRQFAVNRTHDRTDGRFIEFSQSTHDAALQARRGIRAEEFGHGGQRFRMGGPQTEQTAGGGQPGFLGGAGIRQGGRDAGRDFADLRFQGAIAVPFGSHRKDTAGYAAGEQLAKRRRQFRCHGRSILQGLAQRVEDGALQWIGGFGFGGDQRHQFGGRRSVVVAGDRIHQLGHEGNQVRGTGTVQSSGNAAGRIAGGGSHGSTALEVVVQLRPGGDDLPGGGVADLHGTERTQGCHPYCGVRITDQTGGLFFRLNGSGGHLSNSGSIPADRQVRISQRGGEQFRADGLQTTQGPEGGDFCVGVALLQQVGDRGRRGSLFNQEPAGRQADGPVGMSEGRSELGGIGFGEVGDFQLLRLFVLDAPDTAEIVVAVGADRGVDFVMVGAAGVVVDDGLVVKIADIHRTIGTGADLDRTPPLVRAADEFRFLPAGQLVGLIAGGLGRQALMVDQVDGGFGGEVVAVVFGRPGAAVINHGSGSGGEVTHPVNLHVGKVFILDGRVALLAADDGVEARGVADLAAGEGILRQDDLIEQGAAGGLRPHHPVVAGDGEAPGVAAFGGVLLDFGTVRFEAHHAAADVAKVLAAVAAGDIRGGTVAVGGVDPAVPTHAGIVDNRMGVASAEIGVEFLDLVGLAVSIGVPQPENVRGLGDNDAVLVKHEAGDEVESLMEHVFFVHHAIGIGVGEDADFVHPGAVLDAGLGLQSAVILPLLAAIVRAHAATAIGVFRSFSHPETAAGVPVKIHRFCDQRLGRDQRHVEVRMHFQIFQGGFRFLRTTFRIGQGGQLLRRAEFIDTGTLAGPGQAPQENGAVVGFLERGVEMARNADKCPVGLGAAFHGPLVGPHLRLDVVDVRLAAIRRFLAVADVGGVGGGEDAHVGGDVHVVINLVVDVEVGGIPCDGMAAVEPLVFHVVEVHRTFLPLGGFAPPASARDRLPVILLTADRSRVHHHQAAASLQVFIKSGPPRRRHRAAVLGIHQEHIGLLQFIVAGQIHPTVHLQTPRGEEGLPVLEELGVFVGTRSVGLDAAADKDPQRGISSKGGQSGQDQQAEGEELGFHRNKRKENRRAGTPESHQYARRAWKYPRLGVLLSLKLGDLATLRAA